MEESGLGRYRAFLLGCLVETVGRLLLPKEVGKQNREWGLSQGIRGGSHTSVCTMLTLLDRSSRTQL